MIEHYTIFEKRAAHLPTLRLTTATHSNRCLEASHYSSAVNDWWSISTWANGHHSLRNFFTVVLRYFLQSVSLHQDHIKGELAKTSWHVCHKQQSANIFTPL